VTHELTRCFAISSPKQRLFALACQPMLAPRYLNFLTGIAPLGETKEVGAWKRYHVDVSYRALLKTSGVVEHCSDEIAHSAHLRHDGTLACFDASFKIGEDHVDLTCTYQAKVPLVRWLIRFVLHRALGRVAHAMDRYAASSALSPT
jgi:hypothetical protein